MIVRWNPKNHYKAVASWYHARDLEAPPPHMLPDIGFIVDDRVAGFLYQTDSTICLIDGVVSNPFTTPAQRRQSVDVLIGTLVDTALLLGFTTILGLTKHPLMKKRAGKFGFRPTEQSLFILSEE